MYSRFNLWIYIFLILINFILKRKMLGKWFHLMQHQAKKIEKKENEKSQQNNITS